MMQSPRNSRCEPRQHPSSIDKTDHRKPYTPALKCEVTYLNFKLQSYEIGGALVSLLMSPATSLLGIGIIPVEFQQMSR